VNDVVVLERTVNPQEPVTVGTTGDHVRVTFAVHGLHGVSFVLDAESLVPHLTEPFEFEAHTLGRPPPFLPLYPVIVQLHEGRSLAVWTDDATGKVVGQNRGTDGLAEGARVPVSPPGVVAFGAPRAASPDGRHVVVAFLAVVDEHFELMAATLEAP